MKPTKAISLMLCFVLTMLTLCGCASKTALTPDEFTAIMHRSGFVISDATAETDSGGFATKVLKGKGASFEIEFTELLNATAAETIYEYNKEEFKKEHPVRTHSYETNAGNLNCFYFQAGGNFHIIAQIEDTLLYCEAAETCKSEIMELFKTLGYK